MSGNPIWEDKVMTYLKFILICLLTLTAYPGATYASEFGTPDEARAMLERAVAALQTDKSAALEAFNEKDGGYQDRDLYIFCGDPDGNLTAHARPNAIGRPLRSFMDVSGKPVGEEMYDIAKEGEISKVIYLLPRREEPGPRKKTSLVTKVDDQICGVGYFNPGEPEPTGNSAIAVYEDVFIFGYDPVAYFTMGKAVKGSADFSYEYLGGSWHFANAEHKQMFVDEPVKHVPQHGGYCSSFATDGGVVAANPRAWRIIDGKLYLFAGEWRIKDYDTDDPSVLAANAGWQHKLMELVSQ
jgi:YHS domain-containing protein